MSAEATVLVTGEGFRKVEPGEEFVPIAEAGEGVLRLEVPADGEPSAAVPHFATAEVIRVPFRSFSDGRGFTLARELRRLGYRGRIRASGHLISDQWPLARACGIDEVEITEAQAERQTEAAWAASRRPFRYLDVLR
jgi:uncharacterized protein (DUF934 family)